VTVTKDATHGKKSPRIIKSTATAHEERTHLEDLPIPMPPTNTLYQSSMTTLQMQRVTAQVAGGVHYFEPGARLFFPLG
jgi:hypothetical protein